MSSKTIEFSVFNFTSMAEYLSELLEFKQQKNPNFSLRSWAKFLGYNGPSYLHQVMASQKKSNISLVNRIASSESLSLRERKYLTVLHYKNISKDEEREIFESLLVDLKPMQESNLSMDEFSVLSKWYAISMLEMTRLKNFGGHQSEFVSLLKGQVEEEEVSTTLEELVRAGFLIVDNEVYNKTSKSTLVLEPKKSSAAVRLFHSECLEKARHELDLQDVNSRDFRCTTMTFNKEDYQEVTDTIKDCHQKILKIANKTNEGDSTYIFQSQFFRIV
jgi:uncharacterized protein (TIGR02147 family)